MPTNDSELFLTLLDYLIQFVSLLAISYFSIRYVDKKRGVPPRPKGFWWLGLFLLTCAAYDLLNFIDYDYYVLTFIDLPKWLIITRYIFSIILRIAIIYITLGVLYYNERARKLLIAVAVFTIVTVSWKHPYRAFETTALMTEQAWGLDTSQGLNYPQFPWISMLVYVIADILIAAVTIFCLTLPSIKALFKNEKSSSAVKAET